jgi:transporter family-2 protein
MASLLWPLLGVIAGSFIALQAPINAQLSRGLGMPTAASGASFLFGALVLVVISIVASRIQGITIAWGVPAPWLFVAGGCLGAAYVTSALILVPRLGTAATMAFVVAGQLLAGMVIDRLGFLGTAVHEISIGRVAGAVLLLAGALMIRIF